MMLMARVNLREAIEDGYHIHLVDLSTMLSSLTPGCSRRSASHKEGSRTEEILSS